MATAQPKAEPGVDLETLFEQVGFKPHSEGQWEYCRSQHRFNIPCCGRRWGKSIATGHRATHKTFIPDSYTWVVGPTYKLGEKEFRVVYRDYEKLGLLKYCRKSYSVNQGNMRIETPWHSVIEVVSAEKPDSLLGEGLTHVIMSESARHNRDTWEQYIEPALSDLLGTADFPSTPVGYNWYHGLWLLGQDPNQPDYISWQYPSWSNPVRYPGGEKNAEIIRLRARLSKQKFDQEYGAQFTSYAGAIYEEFDARIHVKEHTFNPHWPNYLAFDFGFANPFVCLDIQVDPNDNVYVWREYYSRFKSTHEHGLYLKSRENPDNYNVSAMYGDPRGANEIATLALSLGHIAAIDVPWKHGVEQIKQLLKAQKLFISPNCPNLKRQIEQLHVKPESRQRLQDIQEHVSDGNIQHKVDDHAADALRYFIGPHFVLGAGSHLEDVYGQAYIGSESDDFFKLHSGISLTGSSIKL